MPAKTIDGVKVVDAKKRLILKISDRDVKLGNTMDPSTCAAARCLIRDPHIDEARVHLSRVYIKTDRKWWRFRTGRALRTEIIAFDRGGRFEPGVYALEAIAPSGRTTGRTQGSKRAVKAKGHTPKFRHLKPLKPQAVKGVRERASRT